jgi:7-cyano-7-deazaguanine synthase
MPDLPKLAVVLMSGGMDSALCAAMAKKDGYDIAALHLNYGQKTEKRELKSFDELCKFFSVKQTFVVSVEHLALIGKSSLTDKNIEIQKADITRKEIPTSYIPFRNGNILSIAASWAEAIEASAIYIGAMQLDSSGYPDCHQEFFDAFQTAINTGTKPDTNIKIITPIINYTKKDIVLLGEKLNVPFHLTWSCYQNEDIACGVCDSCALRLRGFREAGLEDPLPYVQRPDYF